MAELRTVYPPEIWARESVMVLKNTHVAANLVHRDFQPLVAEFGDVVNTRSRTRGTIGTVSHTATGSISFERAAATNIAVTLSNHNYTAFEILDRDQSTSMHDLIAEYIEPFTIPIAQNVDDTLLGTSYLTAFSGAGAIAQIPATATLAIGDFARVRGQLRQQQCPLSGSGNDVSIVLGLEHEEEALQITQLITAETYGVNPPAVQTGFIRRIYGMNVYADQGVPAGTSSLSGQSVAFHRRAVTMISRPLARPASEFGVRSSVMELDGVAMRFMQSYSHSGVTYNCSFDHLWGAQLLDRNLACILTDNVRA